MTTPTLSISHKSFNVNSKKLAAAVMNIFYENANDFVYLNYKGDLNHDVLIEYISYCMKELQEEKAITHYRIVADHRNNTPSLLSSSSFKVDIEYRQFNCLNITKHCVQITTR